MKRTDRILIAMALLVLCSALGSFYGFDSIFGRGGRGDLEKNAVAVIVGGRGDTRVRYKDELHWQKARNEQKLIYDDAIFAGDASKVDLKVGNSNLTVDSNTLIVLRKRELFSTLNLNYGDLHGLIAQGDKLMIETHGEVVELSASKMTRVSISKKAEKMTIQVDQGIARVVKDGKVHIITPKDQPIMVVEKKPDPLTLAAPERIYFYSSGGSRALDFGWAYQSRRVATPDDEFTLEFSEQNSFERLSAKEVVRGQLSAQVPLPVPSSLYYRVRDKEGVVSPPKRLVLAAPSPPSMASPLPESESEAPEGRPLTLAIGLKPLDPGSRARVQVATDPEFKNLVFDKASTVPEMRAELAPDEYYIRTQAIYDADKLNSAWSEPAHISIREPLELNQMARVGMPYEVTIPNRDYPRPMYTATEADVQKYVSEMKPFPEFFAAYMRKGYDLVIRRRNTADSGQKHNRAVFPAEWIYPGRVDIIYKMEARGVERSKPQVHRLRITLEPAKNLKATPQGRLRWSPLLFAQGYEGELSETGAGTSTFITRGPAHNALLNPGAKYSYRVRALGRGGVPISSWSSPYHFESEAEALPALPEPPLPPVLTETKPPDPARAPAQESASNSVRMKGERSLWERVGAWLWAGTGFNFVMVRQTIASTADVEYKNTKAPSAYVEAGYLNERYGGVVSYKRTPGEIRVDNYPVDRRDFVWSTASAEGLLLLPWRGSVLNSPLMWGLRAGVQSHQFPFLFVGTGRNLIQATNNMTTASIGFFTESIGRMKYHWSMRYQQPLQASTEGGNQFSVNPVVAFDGSLGASYLLSKGFKTGLFWYGQMHNYNFTYTSSTQSNSGKQWLFYSNAELRLGYDF